MPAEESETSEDFEVTIAEVCGEPDGIALSDAEFIERAVNCHYELLEALQAAIGIVGWAGDNGGDRHGVKAVEDMCRAAIAKATGQTVEA